MAGVWAKKHVKILAEKLIVGAGSLPGRRKPSHTHECQAPVYSAGQGSSTTRETLSYWGEGRPCHAPAASFLRISMWWFSTSLHAVIAYVAI